MNILETVWVSVIIKKDTKSNPKIFKIGNSDTK